MKQELKSLELGMYQIIHLLSLGIQRQFVPDFQYDVLLLPAGLEFKGRQTNGSSHFGKGNFNVEALLQGQNADW